MFRFVIRRITVALSASGVLLAGAAVVGCDSGAQAPKPASTSAPAPTQEATPPPGKKAAKGRNLGPQPGSADYADKPGRGPRGK